MGYWFCKKHGKQQHMPACRHIKESVDNGEKINFNLIREEMSQDEKMYISTLLCDECSKQIGVDSSSVVYIDPEIRKFEHNELEGVDEIKYKGIYDNLNEKLTSICTLCLSDVYPNYDSIINNYKNTAIELNKEKV